MLDTYEQNSNRKLIATVLTILVIAGSVVFVDHAKSEASEHASKAPQTSLIAATPASSPAPTPAATQHAAMSSTSTAISPYKDGTYAASASYYVPRGNENIQVNVTLSSGVITNATIRNSQGDDVSAQYQQDFASVYKSYVVGKKISGLRIGIIAGASDTTQGFADALTQILSKAKA